MIKVIMKIIQTFRRLHFFQKISLLGLVIMGMSLPASIILSAYETHFNSKAAQEISRIQVMPRDRANDPRLSITSTPNRFIRYPIEASISGVIKPPMLPPQTGCITGGCSGELCLSATEGYDRFSTCEWKESYACLKSSAICEQQASGQCGWTFTPEYYACLKFGYKDSDETRPKALCGNGQCEPLEADQEICTRSLPPQCHTIKGACNEDCTNPTPPAKPTGGELMCAKECALGYYLNSECNCVRERYQMDTGSLEQTRETRQASVCEKSGGEYKTLSGCADSCDVLTDPLIACPADSQQVACDCGPAHCWNGARCINNPATKANDSLAKFGFTNWVSSFRSFFDAYFK